MRPRPSQYTTAVLVPVHGRECSWGGKKPLPICYIWDLIWDLTLNSAYP